MRKLEIRISYNVTLVHFVDSLSKWDVFVASQVSDYFAKEFEVNPQDAVFLSKYVEVRSTLGWDSQAKLFNWSYSGFEEDETFSELLPTIKYFEKRVNKAGNSLKEILLKVFQQLQRNKYDMLTTALFDEYKEFIRKAGELFQSETNEKVLFCYLTYSPDESQTSGGANGDGIFLELTQKDIDEMKIDKTVILHEYFHKCVTPYRYFLQNNVLNGERTIEKLGYRGEFKHYVEEVIVHALCEILFSFKQEMENQLDYYQSMNDDNIVGIWNAVYMVIPMLRDYFSGKADIRLTRQLLESYFVGKAK